MYPRVHLTTVRVAMAGCLLAGFAYGPFLSLPLISDDYVQIDMARRYGAPEQWADLAGDVLYRSRATSLVLTRAVDALFGAHAFAHNVVNLVLHFLDICLIAGLARWPVFGARIAWPAALFYAIHEGHQEAVVWNAALPELLMVSFLLLALHAWPCRKPLAFLAFLLALFSKESAVAILPVLAWLEWREPRRGVPWLAAMALVSAFYAALIFASTSTHLHLNDGTFSWRAPFWWTLPATLGRMLWIWGLVALVVVGWWRRTGFALGFVLLWMVAALLPYSFLTYMERVPSRHTYLAAVGLALLVGQAMAILPWRTAVLAAGLMLAHNVSYLWVKKLPQYAERARITEDFIARIAPVSDPIEVACGPFPLAVFRSAAVIRLGRPPQSVVGAGEREPAPAFRYCDPRRP